MENNLYKLAKYFDDLARWSQSRIIDKNTCLKVFASEHWLTLWDISFDKSKSLIYKETDNSTYGEIQIYYDKDLPAGYLTRTVLEGVDGIYC